MKKIAILLTSTMSFFWFSCQPSINGTSPPEEVQILIKEVDLAIENQRLKASYIVDVIASDSILVSAEFGFTDGFLQKPKNVFVETVKLGNGINTITLSETLPFNLPSGRLFYALSIFNPVAPTSLSPGRTDHMRYTEYQVAPGSPNPGITWLGEIDPCQIPDLCEKGTLQLTPFNRAGGPSYMHLLTQYSMWSDFDVQVQLDSLDRFGNLRVVNSDTLTSRNLIWETVLLRPGIGTDEPFFSNFMMSFIRISYDKYNPGFLRGRALVVAVWIIWPDRQCELTTPFTEFDNDLVRLADRTRREVLGIREVGDVVNGFPGIFESHVISFVRQNLDDYGCLPDPRVHQTNHPFIVFFNENETIAAREYRVDQHNSFFGVYAFTYGAEDNEQGNFLPDTTIAVDLAIPLIDSFGDAARLFKKSFRDELEAYRGKVYNKIPTVIAREDPARKSEWRKYHNKE